MRLHSSASLHEVLALFAQGRRLLTNLRQCYAFAFASYLLLFVVLLLRTIVDAPQVFTTYAFACVHSFVMP